jgi:AAA-like domain
MKIEEALAIVDTVFAPDRLTSIQELVFCQCWEGKSYQEIAESAGYDADYIRVVGSRLWQILSSAFGEKITKNNVQAVLRQRSKAKDHGKVLHNPIATFTEPTGSLAIPGGQVPIDSPLYIERPPIEGYSYEEVVKPGSLLRIKAPRQMGKTSLMARILAYAEARGYQVVRLNLQQADRAVLGDLNKFLRWFCAYLTRQLKLEPCLDDYWDEDLGSKVSCTTYLQEYVLTALQSPLVLALDEVNRIFEYAEIAQDFLPLLRLWHEEANNLGVWEKLRIVVVHSTEAYIPLNINQSPFNIGLPIQLREFNLPQVQDLARRYGMDWLGGTGGEQRLADMIALVGGHPYLVSVALYHLFNKELMIEQLLQEAPTPIGIYGNHLQAHLATLQEHPELATAFKTAVTANLPVKIESIAAYKLYSMGLVTLQGTEVVPSCELYRLYFRERLHQL